MKIGDFVRPNNKYAISYSARSQNIGRIVVLNNNISCEVNWGAGSKIGEWVDFLQIAELSDIEKMTWILENE